MDSADVVIIGGGAAGLFCAITAGQRGRRVVVLEGSNKIGKKILMSGGGRCNFTNLHTGPHCFISENPHFCKSALSRYSQWDFISLVEKHGIAFHEKTLGQLFCDKSSKDIVAMLRTECAANEVSIVTGCDDAIVTDITPYEVSCNKGEFAANSLVVASGGLSIPKMGASDFGYRTARQFGLNVLETRAGLVPFTLTGKAHEMCQRLAGVSCRVSVTTDSASFDDDILFTHRGLSGPAMLQISSYWIPGDSITVNVLPDADESLLVAAKLLRPRSTVRTALANSLPKALVAELQDEFWSRSSELPLGDFSDTQLRAIMAALQSWTIKPAATEGYRTAEVTIGGVDTDELSSKTMQSHRHSGLFFIGEVVDVTGQLGGHNFQWAWASGHAAGLVV